MQLLEDLYFGNIEINGYMPKGSNAPKILARVTNTEEALMEKLEGKEKDLLIDFSNAYAELNGTTAVESFIAGFSMGAALINEACATANDMVLK